jgi:hypothetical protein
LHAISQSTDSVANYITRFERLLYEAKGHKWDDDRRIGAFRQGLNATIKNRLAQQLTLPATYREFLKAIQKLSSRFGYAIASAASTNAAPNAAPNRPPRIQQPPQTPAADPMDLSNVEYEFGNIGSIELAPKPHKDCKATGSCLLRFGLRSHWIKDCPQDPPVPRAKHKLWDGWQGHEVEEASGEDF